MKHFSILVASLVFGVTAWAQAPQVTQVTAQQFGSFVRIAYDLSGPADIPIAVSLAASNDGGALFSLPLTEVHGDVGMHLTPGTGKVAIWDAGADLPDSVNADVRVWVKTWIPDAAPAPLDNTDFVFVYADGPETGGTLRETQLPGFYVTPCVNSTAVDAPAIPQTLVDAYPDFAFEMFQDTVAGETWESLRTRTPWADAPTLTCTEATGWRIAAYYWPSEVGAPVTPDLGVRPCTLANGAAASASFALDTTTRLRDLDEDGVADDKTDHDQDHVIDVLEDFNGNGLADAFEDTNHDQVADGYGAVGTGETALTSFADTNENQLPDHFESRYPITSSTHPRGDRVYFNGSFAGVINGYQPGAAGYQWRIADEETLTLDAGDTALSGPGPHAITAEPGDGIHYLHVAAVDNSDEIIPGSERRFVFNTSLQAPSVSSETHPAPDNASSRPVFAARIEASYGPKQWRGENGTVDSLHQLLVFQNQLWTLNARDGVWRSRDGVAREAVKSTVPWSTAKNLSAVVFRDRMWVHGTFGYWDWDYWVWSSSDGREWQPHRDIPWQHRRGPKLVVFRDALYAFGGTYSNSVESPVWRSLDGETWTQIAPNVAWPAQEDPNIFVYGDSLWLNPRAAGEPTGGVQPGAWRSWDGVTWVPAEQDITSKEDAEGESSPSETDWLGWHNVAWRYSLYPWSGVFTAFQESLWLAGLSPWGSSETTGNDNYWWFNSDHEFSLATTVVSPPPNGAAAISYRGRLHLIGDASGDTVHSEFVDDWYVSNLNGIRGTDIQLAYFDGALWSYDRNYYKVRRVTDNGVVSDKYYSVHKQGKFVAFRDALWLFGGQDTYNAFLATAETSSDGMHWTTTNALPWGPRRDMRMVVKDGVLWLVGGYSPGPSPTTYKDVWRSEDGLNWTKVLDVGPWRGMNPRTLTAYDGALWLYDQDDRTFWRSTDGVNWSQENSGVGIGMSGSAVAAHQDSLFAVSYSDGYIVRRYGRAIAPLDSLEGIRYRIDQSPDTDPVAGEPLTPRTFLESEPLTPGTYWLHLVAVDSLGQSGTVVHRPFNVEAPLPPVIYNDTPDAPIVLPSNQFRFTLFDQSLGLYGEQLFYGLNTEPGGTAETPIVQGNYTVPCVAAGTYWLLASSINMYGMESRVEQMITVTDPVEMPGPELRFAGEAQYAEERLPHMPGDPVDIVVSPTGDTDGPIRYIVDQHRVVDTDFSSGFDAPLPGFTVEPGIGRHFVHAHVLDNCALPTAESVRSILVRKRFAPELHLGAGTTESSIEIVWPAAESNEGGYHYVVDSQPDTVLTADDLYTTDTSLTLPMPSGAWQQYVHVCTADTNGDLSYTGHLKLVGEAERFFALRGPRITQEGLNPYISLGYYTIAEFYVSAPLGNPIAVDANLISVLPNTDNALVVVNPATVDSNEVVVEVVLKREGPVALSLQGGCITDSTGAFPAAMTSLEGMVDKVAPPIQVVPTTPGDDSEAPLMFTVTAPGAEDIFLTNSVLVLERYPDEQMTLSPNLLYENGVWQVIYPGVANTGAMRLRILRNVSTAQLPEPYRCTGYDRAGNCAGPITTPWVDTGNTGPVATIAVNAEPYIRNRVTYSVQWNEPAYQVMGSASITYISDPPGAVTAEMMVLPGLDGYFEIHLSSITGNGSIRIHIPAGFAQDLQSKPSVEAFSASRIVDNVKPVITIGDPTLPSSLGDPISFPVSISGASTIGTPNVTLRETGDVAGTMTIGTPVEAAGEWRYDVQFSNYTGTGTVGVSVSGAAVKDLAGNTAEEAVSAVVPVAVYTLTVTANAGGTVVPAPGIYPYIPGTSVAFTAQAGFGSQFSAWRIAGKPYTSSTITRTIDGNMTVEAIFTSHTKHSADVSNNKMIELTELLRVIQFYNLNGVHCAALASSTEDGYVPGPGSRRSCAHHDSDYMPIDWAVSLSELLRLVQFYNSGAYYTCPTGEDEFCAGVSP